jgi:hypothetical protein
VIVAMIIIGIALLVLMLFLVFFDFYFLGWHLNYFLKINLNPISFEQ